MVVCCIDGYRNDVDFILFDVLISDNYQRRESVEDIAKYFGIDIVPIVLEGTLQDGVDYVLNNIDYLIDGPYDATKRNVALGMRGSENQRVFKFDRK